MTGDDVDPRHGIIEPVDEVGDGEIDDERMTKMSLLWQDGVTDEDEAGADEG